MYQEPEIKVIRFEAEDVITASGGGLTGDDLFGGGDEE